MGKRFALLLLLSTAVVSIGKAASRQQPGTLVRRAEPGQEQRFGAVRGGARVQAAARRFRRAERMTRPPKSGLGRLRDAVFPIYGGEETGKFLALGGIQFFIIFVLTLTRDLKDTLIITSCGAEAISFLKVGIVFSGVGDRRIIPEFYAFSYSSVLTAVISWGTSTASLGWNRDHDGCLDPRSSWRELYKDIP